MKLHMVRSLIPLSHVRQKIALTDLFGINEQSVRLLECIIDTEVA